MSLKTNYLDKSKFPKKNMAVFVNPDTKITKFKGEFDGKINLKIVNFIKKNKNTKNNKIISLNQDFDQKLIIILITKENDELESEKLGAKFFDFVKSNEVDDIFIQGPDFFKSKKYNISFNSFVHGAELKSYEFNLYKTNKKNKIINFNIRRVDTIQKKKNLDAILSGVNFTRDLVSEPGNILHPDEYAKRLLALKKVGLKVTVYDEKKLKSMGCNALLGVGQGSIRGSYLVTVEWNGAKNNSKPLAFVGKGVCFDTGGYSLKPAKFMEDMTYDMAGSAAVVGLMKTLALRKSKINAVGVVGLVENMVSGNAQRPGDIVKSYSGKTIEVLNTDAEGRLVLADVLSYVNKNYKPQYMIDFATLTGAVLVALGHRASGLMGNNDKLINKIQKSSKATDEKVWELPLWPEYTKEIQGKYADIQNLGKAGAGTITAGAFLKEFVGDTPWCHLDIAGTAWGPKEPEYQPKVGATGVAVRLIYHLLEN